MDLIMIILTMYILIVYDNWIMMMMIIMTMMMMLTTTMMNPTEQGQALYMEMANSILFSGP